MAEMIRGDTATLVFPITNKNNENIDINDISELYLTCRRNPSKVYEIIFQKKLEDFRQEEDELYRVDINKEDTETLEIETRVGEEIILYFDIEVTLNNGSRKSKIYQLNIDKDYTIHGGDSNGN